MAIRHSLSRTARTIPHVCAAVILTACAAPSLPSPVVVPTDISAPPSPSATLDSSKRPLVWFAPMPPWQPAAGLPFIGSSDFMNMFPEGAPWTEAAYRVRVLKLYGNWITGNWGPQPTDSDLRRLVAALDRLGVAIAVEERATVCGLGGVEGFSGPIEALGIIQRIQAAGATVRYVALDEPFFYGHLYAAPDACRRPVETIVREVAAFVQAIRDVYPDIVIGDIEPLAARFAINDYAKWLDTYHSVAGSDFAFFHVDMEWSRPGNWWHDVEAARQLETLARERGIDFGIIYDGDHSDTSDKEWLSHAEDRMARYEAQAGGRPDHVIFQSWHAHPNRLLPETDLYTFTHLINRYFRSRTVLSLTAPPFSTNHPKEVTGILMDSMGSPIGSASISLFVTPLYEHSVLEPSILLTDSTITDSNGAFRFRLDPIPTFGILMQARYAGTEQPGSPGNDGYWPAYAEEPSGQPAQNIALKEPATASRSVTDNPAQMAVDGVSGNLWVSGDFAPQWIEINLRNSVSIGQIRLAISQTPDGQTVHRVWGKGPGEPYRLLHEFRGFTVDTQVLEYAPQTPWMGIQFLKVETVSSPSWVAWREIEIFPVTLP